MTFDLSKAVAEANADYFEKRAIPGVDFEIPASIRKERNMTQFNLHIQSITISVAGVEREVEAEVRYIHSRAFGAIVERGSGIPVSPPEPERAEIQSVTITGGEADFQGKRKTFDILHLLTDEQVDAIETEILGG